MKIDEAIEILASNNIEAYEYESKLKEYRRNRKLKFKVGDKVTNAVPLKYGSTLDAEIVEVIQHSKQCYKIYDNKSLGYTWWEPEHLKKI